MQLFFILFLGDYLLKVRIVGDVHDVAESCHLFRGGSNFTRRVLRDGPRRRVLRNGAADRVSDARASAVAVRCGRVLGTRERRSCRVRNKHYITPSLDRLYVMMIMMTKTHHKRHNFYVLMFT